MPKKLTDKQKALLKIKYRDPNDLIPSATNAKIHSDEQITKIAASIKEFGFCAPVLLDGDNVIIAGHGRTLAAIKAGNDKIPTVDLSHLSAAQKKAYMLADNRLGEVGAEWDFGMVEAELLALDEMGFDIDLTGFDDSFFSSDDGLTDSDSTPEIESNLIVSKGEIWVCGDHRVMCGDSASEDDVSELMAGEKIKMVFTDPPYGVSYADKNKFLNAADDGNRIQAEIENDHMTLDETGRLWASVFSVWTNYLSDKSSYYISSPQGGELFLMMMMMNENGFPLRHCLIWNKNNHVLGRCDYNYKHEPILFGWKNTHEFFGNGDMKTSVWDIPKPQKNDLHPTMKPVALVENCLKNSTRRNDVVADFFLGSGTTIIAAEKNGRKCYGMEIDPAYCDVIIRRWQAFTGMQAVRDDDGVLFDDLATASCKD